MPNTYSGCNFWVKLVSTSLEVDPLRCSAQSERTKLTNRDIIFEEIRTPTYVSTIPQRYGHTDRRTDRQLAVATVENKCYIEITNYCSSSTHS